MSVDVRVKLEVECTVTLPDGYERKGQACDDPAIEAAIEGITQQCDIWMWGKDAPVARCFYEVSESDAEIVEDEREETA